MNYIVFDLEFNQSSELHEQKPSAHQKCPFEIIQIGAVRLNDTLEVVDTFNSFVKPILYPTIHPFVANLTGITQHQLDSASPFKEVIKQFLAFMDETSVFCIWGATDMKELFRNVAFHQLNMDLVPKQYINVQQPASKLLQYPGSGNIGLRSAVELLKLSISGAFHDALYDALYTAEIFKKVYNDTLLPQTYSFNPTPMRSNIPKQTLDTDAFFKQFEKMFSKTLSDEEKEMIRIAYLMGKSGQFLIDEKKESQES